MPFDRKLRRMRRDRAAAAPDAGRLLWHRAADELLERVDLARLSPSRALDLGCGSGYLSAALRAHKIAAISVDAGGSFAQAAGGVQAEEDRFVPDAAGFDLIVSAGALDSVNDLPGALLLARRALRPGGMFLAAFAGAGSLPVLRRAIRCAEEAEAQSPGPRFHPQIDVRIAGDLLVRAGFARAVADHEQIGVSYSGLPALIADLRSMAATNLLTERARRPFGRIGLKAASDAFAQEADEEGRTTEIFSIVYMSGWAPEG